MTHKPTHPGHLDFPDGRWLDLRPMYLSDNLAIQDLANADDDGEGGGEGLERMRAYASILERGVTDRSPGFDNLLDMTESRLANVFKWWSDMTEEDALPEVSGADSQTKAPASSSQSAKAGRSQASASPTATPSSPPLPDGASHPGP